MDHFYPQELTVRGSGYSHDLVSPDLHIYCAQETYDLFRRCAEWESDKESLDAMRWHILKAFEPVQAGPYTITPLPANHMNSSFEPFIYHISDSEGTSVYYLHDSGYYAPEVWAYFKKQKPADLISLDTTCGELDLKLQGTHMGINDVIKVCGEMREIGLADAHTRCVMNHFSHNGHLMHHEMEALAAPVGMEVSFDGMRIDL